MAALLESAFVGKHHEVGRLLHDGAAVEVVDRDGYTPLSEASVAGHTVVVGQLLRALADPNRQANDGRTALHRAAIHGWSPVVRILLEHGADPRIRDESGRTAAQLGTTDIFDEFPPEHTEALREKWREELDKRPLPPVEVEAACGPSIDVVGETIQVSHNLVDPIDADVMDCATEMVDDLPSITSVDVAEKALPTSTPASLQVCGAGETRLNGFYRNKCCWKEQVEFEKVDDVQCQIFWNTLAGEWRMFAGDYKLGSTLYRHTRRPNMLEDCSGAPNDGWQIWFGKAPAPCLRPTHNTSQATSGVAVSAAGDEVQSHVVCEGDVPGEVESDVITCRAEYLEVRSTLEIATASTHHAVDDGPNVWKAPTNSVFLGNQIVETAEGLFDAGELQETEEQLHTAQFRAASEWLDHFSCTEVDSDVAAVVAAKAHAQELFRERRVQDALEVTTAALDALRRTECLDTSSTIQDLEGVLHSNRALLLQHQIDAEDKQILAFGTDVAWRLVLTEAGSGLAKNPENFKARFRQARAFFELGDFDQALSDSTIVMDHYSRSDVPNPEAVALHKRIQEAVQKDRTKWGVCRARWNRSRVWGKDVSTLLEAPARAYHTSNNIKMPWEHSPAPRSGLVASTMRPAPPKTGSDVEKAVMVTLKGQTLEQLEYVKQHLCGDTLTRLKRTPIGVDLLSTFVRILTVLAEEDVGRASEVLAALAATPSAKLHVEMFDAEERGAWENLLARVGPDVWIAQ